MAISAPISGALSDKIGSRKPGMIGMALLSGALIWLSTLNTTAPLWQVILGLALAGLGTGTFITAQYQRTYGCSAQKNVRALPPGLWAQPVILVWFWVVGMAGAVFTSHLAKDAVNGLASGISTGLLVAAGIAAVGIFYIGHERREEVD